MSAQAASARETARRADGRFGEQGRPDPGQISLRGGADWRDNPDLALHHATFGREEWSYLTWRDDSQLVARWDDRDPGPSTITTTGDTCTVDGVEHTFTPQWHTRHEELPDGSIRESRQSRVNPMVSQGFYTEPGGQYTRFTDSRSHGGYGTFGIRHNPNGTHTYLKETAGDKSADRSASTPLFTYDPGSEYLPEVEIRDGRLDVERHIGGERIHQEYATYRGQVMVNTRHADGTRSVWKDGRPVVERRRLTSWSRSGADLRIVTEDGQTFTA